MATNLQVRAAVHYLEDNIIKPTSWKLTDKSLVWYETEHCQLLKHGTLEVLEEWERKARHVLPISELLEWYDIHYRVE